MPGALELDVLVVPGASRARVLGRHGALVRVAVAEPPEDGRANRAVAALVAATLGVPVRRVTVERGHRHRRKVLRVELEPEAGRDGAASGRERGEHGTRALDATPAALAARLEAAGSPGSASGGSQQAGDR